MSFLFILLIVLEISGLYTFKVQAVDSYGIGEAAYLYNVTIEGQQSVPTIKSLTVLTDNVPQVLSKDVNSDSDSIYAVAGGAAGSGVFFCLAAFALLFIVKRIRKNSRNRSIKVQPIFSIYRHFKCYFGQGACRHLFVAGEIYQK